MNVGTAIIRYTGATPGADANTYPIFDTVTAFPAPRYCAMHTMKRLQLGLSNSQAGTYNWYKSSSRVSNPSLTTSQVTWTQVGTLAVAAGATAENTNDFLIEEYDDFKLEFVNGGVAQATWVVNIGLSNERNKGT